MALAEQIDRKTKGVFKDLSSTPVTLEYGVGCHIDPEVIVDSPERIHIGSNTTIRKGVVLRPESGEIVIGDNCVINHYCVFHAKGGIYIGDWSIIAPHCGFYAHNHGYDRFDVPIMQQINSGKGIYLMGDNWIGSHAVICDDVTLGRGAIIGANATVTRSVPMAAIATGSPARVIKYRYGENWDFHQRERAVADGMPAEILKYVLDRAELLKGLINPDDSVLDVGCGEGIITSAVAGRAESTVGCDYCSSSVSKAALEYPGVKFVASNVTNLKFEDNRFTRVIFSEVAEHLLPVQLRHALTEITRILRPEGALLLTTPVTGAGARTSTYSHIYEYSLQEITGILEEYFDDVNYVHPEFGLFVATGVTDRRADR